VPIHRLLVLTPSVHGKDGISAVSRHVLSSISAHCPRISLECLSLASAEPSALTAGLPRTVRSASGNRLRFVSWTLQRATRADSRTLVLVLHVHLAPLALPFSLHGAETSVFVHGIEAWKPLGRLQRIAVQRAHRLIGNSAYTIDGFRTANPRCICPDTRICHLGVSSSIEGAAPRQYRETFALITGRMAAEERYKGHDLLIELWPSIVASVPSATLIIAGGGNDRHRLEAKTSALKMDGHIRFAGEVTDEGLAGLYRDCAFFVMPSRKEGFGLVFLEAMRAAKPCIAAKGAASEIIADNETGRIVDAGDASGLQAAIIAMFRDPSLRSRMGLAGQERFRLNFTTELFADRLLNVLGLNREPTLKPNSSETHRESSFGVC
jgi:phosphatidyl-myo-inositol dimannoside synthase